MDRVGFASQIRMGAARGYRRRERDGDFPRRATEGRLAKWTRIGAQRDFGRILRGQPESALTMISDMLGASAVQTRPALSNEARNNTHSVPRLISAFVSWSNSYRQFIGFMGFIGSIDFMGSIGFIGFI
jgi:hypothetical protein